MAAGQRTVTVVFTDLVGSTMLVQRLNAGAADALREAHFGLLRAEVAAVGGRVVKNQGDGLMVVVDSPSAGLSCAVGMQQAVERHNRTAVERLAMRVGIATGEATESEGDVFGDPVVAAARLCAAAEGGQILATDVVRVVAGRHATQELVAVGALALKGLVDPVACVEVRWEPSGDDEEAGAVPLPGRLAELSGLGGFVGRGVELALLHEALKDAGGERRRRVVLVGGEPGIGKSTLAAVFARAAHGQGAVVLYGRCDEDLGISYQPWAEALGYLIDHAPSGLLDPVVAAEGAVLARLGPALAHLGEGGAGGSADPETARYLLFGAVAQVLQAAGEHHPVVVVLDDVQWADRPSLQLWRHLVGSDQAAPVVMVATFRDSEVGAGHALAELLAWLHGEAGVTRISLGGLGDVELLALMEARAGHPVGVEGAVLRDALHKETDGNPFFVLELLRHLAETGAIYQDATGRWAVSGDVRDRGLPVSVREVIGQRVARLGAEAVRVLAVAAVIGRDFDLGVLAAAADSAEESLLDVLDAAVAATLVVNVAAERYSFTHALVEHALYDRLTPARRSRAHRRVAEAIEAACGANPGPRVGELAYHWAQITSPADAAKAIGYARAAGDRALAQLAPADALRWYDQALDLLDQQPAGDERLRAGLLAGLGRAQRQTGDPRYRQTLLDAARLAQHVGDSDTLIGVALANNRGAYSSHGRVDTERVAVIEAALAAVGDGDSARRARLLSRLASERIWDGDYPGRRAVADQALAMARRIDQPATLLDVLLRRFQAIWIPDGLADRLADTAEAESLAEQFGDPIGRCWSTRNRLYPAIESADLAEFTRCVDSQAALTARIGQPKLLWGSTLFQSGWMLLAGDAHGAEALAEQTLQVCNQIGEPDAVIFYAGLIDGVRWHQGRLDELTDMLAAIIADYPGASDFRAYLARSYADAGHDHQACLLLDAEAAAGFPLPEDLSLLPALAAWAETAARLRDRAAAEMLLQRLAPWPDQVVYTGSYVLGAVAHYLGHLAAVLGSHNSAETHFTHAQAIHERLQAPFHLARTHLEWGRMLSARAQPGDHDAARAHLETAQDLAQSHGCALVEQRVTELLREQ